MKNNITAVILAAGKSTRMKSETPKVLHQICYRPMLFYVLDLVRDLRIQREILVLGYKHQEIRKRLAPGIKVIIQKRLMGTADAVKQALAHLRNFSGTVLVLYGDNPLLKKETVKKLLDYHLENKMDATLLTARMDNPAGYGRILRDKYEGICGIVEEKDANDFQKDIKEINTGVVCFNKKRLVSALRAVKLNARKREYYLTDVIGILYRQGFLVGSVSISDAKEALGINSREELAVAYKVIQQRINQEIMKKGVTIIDPASTFIAYGTEIGEDSVIYPFTVIEKDVKIGKNCSVGPFIHLRGGTRLADSVAAGNFLELVRSQISSHTLAKHFGYIGDSRIGSHVNIGAGFVTANFDGKKKYPTAIKDRAFIGSDTVLIAPVKIGRAATTGAGSVVLKKRNVSDRQVVAGVPAKPIK